MDATALVILAVSVVLYFATRKNEARRGLKSASYFGMGVGIGLLVGAFWAASLVNQAFSGF